MAKLEPPVEYLLECSRTSLHSFRLAQLNRSALARKDARKLLDDWIEAEALELLAEWFIEHGEEIVALAASPRTAVEAAPPTRRETPAGDLRIEIPNETAKFLDRGRAKRFPFRRLGARNHRLAATD